MPSVTVPKADRIKAEIDQLRAELRTLDGQTSTLRDKLRRLEQEHIELTVAYRIGDIVEDEKGVQYRVTGVGYGTGASPLRLSGIRLAKQGSEAHKDSRPIYSAKLKKVN